MRERKTLLWFLVISFGFSWVLFLVPLLFGPVTSPTRQLVTLLAWALAMWGPGLAAIITTRFIARQPVAATLHLRRLGPKRAYLWAWLLPPALAIVTGAFTLAFGQGRLDLEFTMIREAMEGAAGGTAVPPAVVVALQIILAFTVGPVFNLLFAFGEELGWRGFLLPHLLPLGQWRAIAVSSAIWGIWHAPAIMQGHNYPGYPMLGVLMMVIFCLLSGAIFSWLYLWTESPWAPALAHASLNASAGLPLLFLLDVNIVIGGTITSVIGWAGLAAFVGWLIWTRRLPVRGVPPETTPVMNNRPLQS